MRDPRLTPARGDLAAKYLEGKVEADRFVTGEEFEVVEAIAPMREQPFSNAMLMTEALRGERAPNIRLPRSLDQAATRRHAGAGVEARSGARGRQFCGNARRNIFAEGASYTTRSLRAGLRRCRRALRRHALSLGRQEQPWHRLL